MKTVLLRMDFIVLPADWPTGYNGWSNGQYRTTRSTEDAGSIFPTEPPSSNATAPPA